MGATTQKSIKSITQSRYSFVHPKSSQPFQLSCWRYTQQDLESREQIEGESMNWPFKLYSDQGYIFALIENTAGDHQISKHNQNSKGEFWSQLGTMKITVSLIEFLYSFANKEIEEYYSILIELQNKSKYIKDQLLLTIYIYPGENLSSYAKLKLFSRAVELERYISRGGICAISKLYHDYQTLVDLRKEVKSDGQGKAKNDEFYLDLSTLVEDRIKNTEDQKMKAEIQQRQLKSLFQRLSKFTLLKKLLLFPFISNYNKYQLFQNLQNKSLYPQVDCSSWSNHKNLIIPTQPTNSKANDIKNPLKQHFQKQKQDKNPRLSQSNLNQSLPFACQITQINYRQRKKDGQVQFLNESLSIADLTALNEKISNFIKISCDEQDYIILTDYISLRQYSKCQEHNIRFIINNSASLCYNYYINDIEHIWNYVTPLPNKLPSDYVLFQYNLEHMMEEMTEKIIQRTGGNKKGDKLNNRVAIYSYNSPFSDENCAMVIGYLICRYLYTFQKAYDILNRHFKQYKKSKQAQLVIHKLYQDQLLTLQGRILISSLSNYGVNLNTSFWRAYQVSNNHCHPSQILISRYIGQISNLNQIQSLPNHGQHVYIVISHQVIPILSAIIDKWEKDATTKIPQGLTGIKIFLGKQFQFKQEYIQKAKEMIAPILKYEFINRGKNRTSFNNQFLLKFIREIAISNTQVENIQKSFRKPQPFTPHYLGFQQQRPGRAMQKITQPYNSKQKLAFKYPYLRPTWQPIKDDQYYFIIQIKQQGASIQIVKGKNWIGLQVDKQVFFENIVKLYLQIFDESKIWITQQGEQSLFGDQMDL